MGKPRSPATLMAGLTTAGAGLYFVLVGVRLAAAPGVPSGLGLLVVCAGLAFGLSGLRIATQGLSGGGESDERTSTEDTADTSDAPAAATIESFAPVAIVFCLAAVATWIAVAGEGRLRLAFAFGALVTWAYFIVLARRSVPALRAANAAAAAAATAAPSARDALFGPGKSRARHRTRPLSALRQQQEVAVRQRAGEVL